MKQYLVIKLAHEALVETQEIAETVAAKITRLLVLDSSFAEVTNLPTGFWDSFSKKSYENLGYHPDLDGFSDKDRLNEVTHIGAWMQMWVVSLNETEEIEKVEEPSYFDFDVVVAIIGKLSLA